jgi:hypothetical protein
MENTNEMLNHATRLIRQANHCQSLLASGLGIPVTLISGKETNKAKAKALILRARKIRLARELVRETFAHGTGTKQFDSINAKLVALR